MATGDITNINASSTGDQISFSVEGMDGSLITGFESGKAANLSITSEGYYVTSLGSKSRTGVQTSFVSASGASPATVTLQLSKPIWDDDTSIQLSVDAGAFDDGSNVSTELVSGAVTNGSTLDYPEPLVRNSAVLQGGKLFGHRDWVESGDFTVEALAVGGGKINTVEITIDDGVTSNTISVSSLALSSYVSNQTGRRDPVYSATFSASDYLDGALTITTTAYPEYGDADSVFSESWTLYNDAGSTAATESVYVSTTGDDTTGDGSIGSPYPDRR